MSTPTPNPDFFTQMCVFEKYGLRLNTQQLAELLGWSVASVNNAVSQGVFPIPTYLDGKRRFADFREVAKHLDSKRAEALQMAKANAGYVRSEA